MASYGLPYMGSKSRIADWLIDQLPSADTFVDLFAGGCAITHCAMVSGKYKNIIANDVDGRGIKLFKDCINGDINLHKAVTREVFFNELDDDFLVSCTGSFGNDSRTYLYGRNLAHKELAETMMFGKTIGEKYTAYKRFIKVIASLVSDGKISKQFTDLERLQRLERLERLERVESIVKGRKPSEVEYTSLDYKAVPVPADAVVYCDPPYANTEKYFKQSFDHNEFYEWLLSRDFPVFISEYEMPKDFECIAQIKRYCAYSGVGNASKVTEKLFVQKDQLENARKMQGFLL